MVMLSQQTWGRYQKIEIEPTTKTEIRQKTGAYRYRTIICNTFQGDFHMTNQIEGAIVASTKRGSEAKKRF